MQADPTFTVVPPEDRLTVVRVFFDADIVMKILMAGLAIAAVIAIVVWVVQASRLGRRRSAGFEGATAYLMALSAAGPMIGFFGSAYTLFAGSLGLANVRPVPTISILAPGFAEALLAAMLGLLAASIAVIGRQHLKAKLYAVEVEARETAAEAAPLRQARAAA
ncbi:MAG: MotA/TolQ/ExbB proton channel family protein [Phenylobacterium sp.]